jgi:predicted nucleic acid-binding protein
MDVMAIKKVFGIIAKAALVILTPTRIDDLVLATQVLESTVKTIKAKKAAHKEEIKQDVLNSLSMAEDILTPEQKD